VTFRAAALRAVGGWSGWLRSAEDWNLYMKLAAAGWRFAYVHRRLARYRWPQPHRGLSYDAARLERWVRLGLLDVAVRHPRVAGPRRELVRRVRRAG
jgi:hypothetical protein